LCYVLMPHRLCPQIEFDPSLDVEVVHTPRGWRDPDLFVSGPDFLDAMRPLLNTYLAAQGEAPLQETEWQVGSCWCRSGQSHGTLAHVLPEDMHLAHTPMAIQTYTVVSVHNKRNACVWVVCTQALTARCAAAAAAGVP
jgi:hypothetical protein